MLGVTRPRLGAATFGLTMTIAAIASADPSSEAAAQALFDSAKTLMDAGRVADACPKFAESERLDPGGGTLLLLAMCHEKLGKTATAWGEFNDALSLARKDKRGDRETAALEHIHSLDARLTRVVVFVSKKIPGLKVTRNDVEVGEAQWSLPIPVDPGEYAFAATAPGMKSWSSSMPVQGEGKTLAVSIPPLDPAPVAIVARPIVATTLAPIAPRDQANDERGAKDLTLPIAVGAVGLVGLGVGAALGFAASSAWSDAKSACPNAVCRDPNDLSLGDKPRALADASTVSFLIGGAGVVAAIVIYAVEPAHAKETSSSALRIAPSVTPRGGGLFLSGAM